MKSRRKGGKLAIKVGIASSYMLLKRNQQRKRTGRHMSINWNMRVINMLLQRVFSSSLMHNNLRILAAEEFEDASIEPVQTVFEQVFTSFRVLS